MTSDKITLSRLKQVQKEKISTQPRWYTLHRALSLYIAWLFLKLNFTPNFVTALSIFSGIFGSILLVFDKLYAFIFLYLYFLLDKVDGDIARYTNNKSFQGIYLDELGHLLVYPLFFISFGYFISTSSKYPIAAIFCAFLVVLIRYMHSLVFTIYSKKMYADTSLAKLLTPASKATSLKAGSSIGFVSVLICTVEFLKEYSTVILLFFISYILGLYFGISIAPSLLVFYSVLFILIFIGQIFLNYSNLNSYLADIHLRLRRNK